MLRCSSWRRVSAGSQVGPTPVPRLSAGAPCISAAHSSLLILPCCEATSMARCVAMMTRKLRGKGLQPPGANRSEMEPLLPAGGTCMHHASQEASTRYNYRLTHPVRWTFETRCNIGTQNQLQQV